MKDFKVSREDGPIWGVEDCDWAFRASEGASGAILSIWRKSNASFVFSFQGEGYVGVCLEWGLEKKYVLLLMYILNAIWWLSRGYGRLWWRSGLVGGRGFVCPW